MTRGPLPLDYALAAVMLTVSVYCAGRLAAAWFAFGRVERDADLGHVAMGVAMAGMLVPRMDPLPTLSWEAIFAAVTAWFACRAARVRLARGGHYAQHGLHGAAMLYMLVAAGGGHAMPSGMPAATGGGQSMTATGALVLAVLLLGCAVWEVDRLTAPPPDMLLIAPRLAGLCRAVLSVAMGYMLVVTM